MSKRKDPAAVSLGRKGGKARLKKMTPEQRQWVASNAGRSFWRHVSPEERSRIMSERRRKGTK